MEKPPEQLDLYFDKEPEKREEMPKIRIPEKIDCDYCGKDFESLEGCQYCMNNSRKKAFIKEHSQDGGSQKK